MDFSFDMSLAKGYKSKSQIARILTEAWVKSQMFCPHCGYPHLTHLKNNLPVKDFHCENCSRVYELKSKNGPFGSYITDGAYDTMMEKVQNKSVPDFLFMNYAMTPTSGEVTDLFLVPKHFFVPSVIEMRNPLSSTAKRAGWKGCNILISQIPEQGRIPIITHQVASDIAKTVNLVKQAEHLNSGSLEGNGWLFDVLNCVNLIPKSQFTLSDVYMFEKDFQLMHPNNHNIQAKIRQQLQRLRDANYIEFLGDGNYRKLKSDS